MSRILVLYGTSEGHTEKIATAISSALCDSGIHCDVIQAGTVDPSVAGYDGVIVAASMHAGVFQETVVASVARHAAEIAARPNAFVAVCLGALQRRNPAVLAELDAIVGRFSSATGWKPAMTKFVAGDLPYTRHNFFMRWIMKRTAAKAGADTNTSRDYVYTDWVDLKSFAVAFGAGVRATGKFREELGEFSPRPFA